MPPERYVGLKSHYDVSSIIINAPITSIAPAPNPHRIIRDCFKGDYGANARGEIQQNASFTVGNFQAYRLGWASIMTFTHIQQDNNFVITSCSRSDGQMFSPIAVTTPIVDQIMTQGVETCTFAYGINTETNQGFILHLDNEEMLRNGLRHVTDHFRDAPPRNWQLFFSRTTDSGRQDFCDSLQRHFNATVNTTIRQIDRNARQSHLEIGITSQEGRIHRFGDVYEIQTPPDGDPRIFTKLREFSQGHGDATPIIPNIPTARRYREDSSCCIC